MAKTNTNLYNELKERGLLYQCTDEEALKKAYKATEGFEFENKYMRTDIGQRALAIKNANK